MSNKYSNAVLYKALVDKYKLNPILDPKHKYRGTYSSKDDSITLREADPIVLAHELGHREDLAKLLPLHAALGGIGNLLNWNRLIRYATYLKEKAAVENGLDILRSVDASPEVVDYAKRDAERYLKEVQGD